MKHCLAKVGADSSRWSCLQLRLQGTWDAILRLEGGQLLRQDLGTSTGLRGFICLFYAIFTQNKVQIG